jgi:hypothetical protein
MYKKLIYLFVGLVAFGACNSSEDFDFKLNLVEGETYPYNMTATSDITQSMFGQTMKTKMIIAGNIDFEVVKDLGDSYDMLLKYNKMTMSMESPQGSIEFGSENPKEDDILSRSLAAFVEKPLSLNMSKTGKINSMGGFDELYDHIVSKFPELNESDKAQIVMQLEQSYGEEAFKGNIEMTTAIYPDNKVKKGQSWEVETLLSAGMDATVLNTYSLINEKDGKLNLKGKAIISTEEENNEYRDMDGMQVRYKFEGDMSSDIVIDAKTGWVLSAKVKQNLNGETEVKDSPEFPGGMSIPLELNTKINVGA